jgi:hypothetical protein
MNVLAIQTRAGAVKRHTTSYADTGCCEWARRVWPAVSRAGAAGAASRPLRWLG